MKALVFSLALAVLGGEVVQAASTGTAWGKVIGYPSCSGLGTERTCILGLTQAGVDVNTYTAVYCQWPLDTWCESVLINETVIISFSLQRFGAPCVGHFFYLPYADGVSKSHYCTPAGSCG